MNNLLNILYVLEVDLIKELAATKDVAEGIGAMLAKRKPVFSGE